MEENLSDLRTQFEEQGKKIDRILISVEKTRKYFLWTMIITVALLVLPLIGLFFAIPTFLGTYSDIQNLGL